MITYVGKHTKSSMEKVKYLINRAIIFNYGNPVLKNKINNFTKYILADLY